jgi:hypothetical protein
MKKTLKIEPDSPVFHMGVNIIKHACVQVGDMLGVIDGAVMKNEGMVMSAQVLVLSADMWEAVNTHS